MCILPYVKVESEKAGLKLNIQKTKFMASGPITSRQTDGETLETVTDFPFWGSRIIFLQPTALNPATQLPNPDFEAPEEPGGLRPWGHRE